MFESFKKTLRDFWEVIDYHTWVVLGLAMISTTVCVAFDFQADIPAGLIGLAVVFPIVFSINAAYRRREEVLRYFGTLKAHAVMLYYAHRDWAPVENCDVHVVRHRDNIENLINAIRDHFLEETGRTYETFKAIYALFSKISKSHEALRAAGVPGNEISRMNQFLSKMMIDFEKMNNILVYRTPNSLRAYSTLFLNAFPILFGPYFARIALDSYIVVGYVVAIVYSLVLVTLDNVQDDLEDPFDQIGADDVKLDVAQFYIPLFKTSDQMEEERDTAVIAAAASDL